MRARACAYVCARVHVCVRVFLFWGWWVGRGRGGGGGGAVHTSKGRILVSQDRRIGGIEPPAVGLVG